MSECNCHSYNADNGDVPEVIMSLPYGGGEKTVCIDACIAHVIKHLWDNEITTQGCCCGHNGKHGMRSIILESNISKDDADNVRELIEKVDDREFTLYSWELTKV